MPDPTTETLRLPAARQAPARARETLRRNCSMLPQGMLDDALLLTTEVVTNAVKFSPAMITVVIECDGVSVAVAVADESTEPPEQQAPANDQTRGRGLQLVDRLASAWGWKPTSDQAGKVVWFRLGELAS